MLTPEMQKAIAEATTSALAVAIPQIVEGCVRAMGREPARIPKPITDEERPKFEEFVKTYWPERQGYRNHRIKPMEILVDAPKKVEGREPEEYVTQLLVIPVEVVRELMSKPLPDLEQPQKQRKAG